MTEMNKQNNSYLNIEGSVKNHHSRQNSDQKSSIMYSVYKDSPKYNQYFKFFPGDSPSLVSNVSISQKRDSIMLENFGILEELSAGK